MRVQPTADVSLNGISVPVRPGLADCIGKRGPAALTVTVHAEFDVIDVAAAMLTILDHEYGVFSELLRDEDAWHEVAVYLVSNGISGTWTSYRDALTTKDPSVCEPRCAALDADEHDEDCLAGWCLTRARHLLAARTGPVSVVPVRSGPRTETRTSVGPVREAVGQ